MSVSMRCHLYIYILLANGVCPTTVYQLPHNICFRKDFKTHRAKSNILGEHPDIQDRISDYENGP